MDEIVIIFIGLAVFLCMLFVSLISDLWKGKCVMVLKGKAHADILRNGWEEDDSQKIHES